MMSMTRMTREILESQVYLSMEVLLKGEFSSTRGSCWRQIPKFRKYLNIEHSSHPRTQARVSLLCMLSLLGWKVEQL